MKPIRLIASTAATNVTSLVVSAVLLFIVPKFVSVEDFGYWQYYLLGISLVGLAHLGVPDGVALRFAGEDSESLPLNALRGQFSVLCYQQLVFVALVTLLVAMLQDGELRTALWFVGVSGCVLNLQSFFVSLMQATGRIRSSLPILLLDRIAFGVLAVTFIAFDARSFEFLIIADLGARALALITAALLNWTVARWVWRLTANGMAEFLSSVIAGAPLLAANFASVLVLATMRFTVGALWPVALFAQFSLVLNISLMLMTLVNAVGTVIFPHLRRLPPSSWPELRARLHDSVSMAALLCLAAYFPLEYLLGLWLPSYSVGIGLMALIFPLIVFEARFGCVTYPFLKALRLERKLLIVNVACLALAAGLAVLFGLVFRSIDLLALSIVPLLAARAWLSDFFVDQVVTTRPRLPGWIICACVIGFIVCGYYLDPMSGLIVYVTLMLALSCRWASGMRHLFRWLVTR